MAKKRFTLVVRAERELGALAETEEEAIAKIKSKIPASWVKDGVEFVTSNSTKLLDLARMG